MDSCSLPPGLSPGVALHDSDVPSVSPFTAVRSPSADRHTSSVVAFLPSTSSPGFSFTYPHLSLHALTPPSDGTPGHLYCQVDDATVRILAESSSAPNGSSGTNGNGIKLNGESGLNGTGMAHEDGEGMEDAEDEGEEEFTPMREIRIYLPEDKCEPGPSTRWTILPLKVLWLPLSPYTLQMRFTLQMRSLLIRYATSSTTSLPSPILLFSTARLLAPSWRFLLRVRGPGRRARCRRR